MKISEQWLRLWVSPEASTEQLCHTLTLAGLEIGAIEPASEPFHHVLVGEIIELLAHPSASHCRVCKVHIGADQLLTIVCGASNIKVGDKVPVALVGAQLPGNINIKKQKVHGVASEGMLCAADELSLTVAGQEASEGVLILDDTAPLGQDCFDYFQLNDKIIEVELTPNRGDCLSISGVAREVGVLFDQAVKSITPEHHSPTSEEQASVVVHEAAACPRYVGRILSGINNQSEVPLWMRERLRRAGQRCINPVVDVLNYVMLELGQPMHAFDWHVLQGDIQIRFARREESLLLLDNRTVKLDKDILVIADQKQPVAVAGIMGGLESAVTTESTSVFLESAFFDPAVIAGRPRRLNAQTDSSYRFERGVDPELQKRAIERATELLLSIVGGEAGPITEVVSDAHLPSPRHIVLRAEKLSSLLGAVVPEQRVEGILRSLGMQVTVVPEGWSVVTPTHRFDLNIERDLIEEVGRVYGYNNISGKALQLEVSLQPVSEKSLSLCSCQQFLVANGYQEVITYSFVDPVKQRLLEPQLEPLALLNPISEDMGVMRTTLWTGLLNTLQYNQNRQIESARYFEAGLCFVPDTKGNLHQVQMLGGLINGDHCPLQWGSVQRPFDFYDLKGDLEALFALTRLPQEFTFQAATHSALHPGQTAAILRNGKPMGYMGALHPSIAETLHLQGATYLFALEVEPLLMAKVPHFSAVSKFPAIRRDLAFVVTETVTAAAIEKVIRDVSCEFLHQIAFFDIYRGKGIEPGQKSVALGLILQHQSRTLIDQEVNDFMEKVVSELKLRLSATMRE